MFAPLRRHPERWLFTGLVALLLAPVIAQGLDRPIASLLGDRPNGVSITACALAVALAGWLVLAAREPARPPVALATTGLVAIALALALGMSPAGLITLAVVAGGGVALTRRLPAALPPAIDGLATRHRLLTIAYGLVAVLSIVQVARVSVFMADPARTDAQIVPGLRFLETHCCLTAYVRANELAHEHMDNLYLAERWPSIDDPELRPETAFSPFDLDEFFYPPAFLLVAEILAPWRGDFLAQRAAWFGINGLLLALAFFWTARALGGPEWHRPLLVGPLFFGSLPVLSILQIGNAQAVVVVGAVLAMLAFETERPALGGFALALATLAKISPGILGVVLISEGRWRAVAWTAGFGVLLGIATLLAYGPGPIESFATYMLPRLDSGEAFSPMLHHPESIAVNLAPGGTPFRLALLGVDVGDPWPLARRINQVVTLVVLVLAIVMGRRQRLRGAQPRGPRALAWLALLFLASLRSPFAPGYVLFAFAWAITLLTAEVRTKRGGVVLLALFALSTVLPPLPTEALAVYAMVTPLLAIAVSLWLILRRAPDHPPGAPTPQATSA